MGERKNWSTSMDYEVLEAFRDKCKEIGLPANLVLEMLMKAFLAGQLEIGVQMKTK